MKRFLLLYIARRLELEVWGRRTLSLLVDDLGGRNY
jgi:hypothetical protein